MSRHTFTFSALLIGGILALGAQAQTPAPTVVQAQTPVLTAQTSPRELLQAMKAQNAALLERQAALLLKLEELQQQATQLKFLTKRG